MDHYLNELDEECQRKLGKLLSCIVFDPELEIPNRQYFNLFLKRELELGRRYNLPISVLFIDVDRLKYINDTYGHLAGDMYLKAVVRAIQKAIRKSDLLIRWGGDEFLVLLHTNYEGALKTQERIRQILNRSSVLIGSKRFKLSASIGLAEVTGSVLDAIHKADVMMYEEKKLKKPLLPEKG